MNPISMLLPELGVASVRPKIRSQRAYVVSLFVERLNQERGDRKQLTSSFIAFKMSHLDVEDLYSFYGQCEKGDIFSKVWWGALKKK